MVNHRPAQKTRRHVKKALPYGRQWIDRRDINKIVRVLRSDWITQGPTVKKLEQKLCEYTGARHAVMVSSGTAALHVACLAAGIGPKDEVLTSPITFVASANCVLYCGGTPVFVDVQDDTVNIDPRAIGKSLTSRTKAIIPVHFAGHPCDLKEIQRIASKYSLKVIEDAAHALGAEFKGSRIGSCRYSDMTTLSFHPVKHITTGEGGAVLTNDRTLYERLLLFRNHGITNDPNKLSHSDGPWSYEQQVLGFNYRISDFQCALGLGQLEKLNRFVSRRREIADAYNRAFSKDGAFIVPLERPDVKSSRHIYYLRVNNSSLRKPLFERLRAAGISTQVHYIPIYRQPYYRNVREKFLRACPVAERYYETTLTLPLYPRMTDADVKRVVRVVKETFASLQ